MKNTELRIGNFLNDYTGKLCKVRGVNKNGISAPRVDGSAMAQPNRPIKLTEEWLIKFGATYTQSRLMLDNFGFMDKELANNTYRHYPTLKRIEYVHQLQNFYFAWNNEELETKKGYP